MSKLKKTISWVVVFAIAMGFLESAVVIYLRVIYYPAGFHFPLRPMDPQLALVEVLREAATVIMLAGIGYLAGSTTLQRFAYFCLAFAVWDLFYYVFLYVFLSWPVSLLTWDILFLIPLPWIGPVWAPCLVALLMAAGSLRIILNCHANPSFCVSRRHWQLLLIGCCICILAFMWDYIAQRTGSDQPPSSQALFADLQHYIPSWFNWPLFLAGFLTMCAPVTRLFLPNLKPNRHEKK